MDGFISHDNPYAYEQAKALVDETYGDTYKVSEPYLSKLESWTKMPDPGQAKALRDLTNFLIKCETIMRHVPEMNILNHHRQNQQILKLLPSYIVTNWNEKVLRHRRDNRRFPQFSLFVSFMKDQSELANLLVTSLAIMFACRNC